MSGFGTNSNGLSGLNNTNNTNNTQGQDGEVRITVVIITAGNCGVCQELKRDQTLARITSSLQSSGVTVFNYDLKNMGDKIKENDRYSSFINRKLVRLWYPLFVALPTSTISRYNSGSYSPSDEELCAELSLFNAAYKDGKFIGAKSYGSYGHATASRWISDYKQKVRSSHQRQQPNTPPKFARQVPEIEPISFPRPSSPISAPSTSNDSITLQVPRHIRTFSSNTEEVPYISCQNLGFTLVPRSK